MKLLRKNTEKQREVFLLDDRIRKVWDISNKELVTAHYSLLAKQLPGYAIDTGFDDTTVWIDYTILPGVPASTFEHTTDFINLIYQFCLKNIQETYPYAHGDWSLSNILINGNDICMCDWDNLQIYNSEEVYKKLHQDLFDSFGVSFLKLIE